MPINRQYNNTVDTQRLDSIAGSFKKDWQANLSDVNCIIHPQGGEHQEVGDGKFFRLFKMWCPVDTDIVIGDRVIDGSTTYSVKGVSVYDFGSPESQHKAVMLLLGE